MRFSTAAARTMVLILGLPKDEDHALGSKAGSPKGQSPVGNIAK